MEAEAHLQILREQKPTARPKKVRPSSAMKASGKAPRRAPDNGGYPGGGGDSSMAIVAVPDSYSNSPPGSAGSSGRDHMRVRHHHAISFAPPDLS